MLQGSTSTGPYGGNGSPNPYVHEHIDLIASVKSGKLLNEGWQVAESCLIPHHAQTDVGELVGL